MAIKVTTMKIATVKEFRNRATKLLRSVEPLLITRHGKAAGLYIPLSDAEALPFELRKELQQSLDKEPFYCITTRFKNFPNTALGATPFSPPARVLV